MAYTGNRNRKIPTGARARAQELRECPTPNPEMGMDIASHGDVKANPAGGCVGPGGFVLPAQRTKPGVYALPPGFSGHNVQSF